MKKQTTGRLARALGGKVLPVMNSESVDTLIERARRRVASKTLIQDVSVPLTGEIDRRKIAAKFSNIEHAVDDLATAVESLGGRIEGQ